MSFSSDKDSRNVHDGRMFQVLWRDKDEEMMVLTRHFFVASNGSIGRVRLSWREDDSYSFSFTAEPQDVMPEGDHLSLAEKVNMRFESVLRGETPRVDLRFCTGNLKKRNPLHDNLHPDYAVPVMKAP
jgi:hypothetical protein